MSRITKSSLGSSWIHSWKKGFKWVYFYLSDNISAGVEHICFVCHCWCPQHWWVPWNGNWSCSSWEVTESTCEIHWSLEFSSHSNEPNCLPFSLWKIECGRTLLLSFLHSAREGPVQTKTGIITLKKKVSPISKIVFPLDKQILNGSVKLV